MKIESAFILTHNLKVRGSNPLPATKSKTLIYMRKARQKWRAFGCLTCP